MNAAVLLLAAATLLGAGEGEPIYRTLDGRDAAYVLDGFDRTIATTGRVTCPKVPLVVHRGAGIRYHKPVQVHQSFRPHLLLFEEVARAVAVEVYGRAPVQMRHAGTLNCRRIARYADLLSEHGLGNAIDVAGFDFAPARRGDERRAAPRGLGGAFQVRLGEHWKAARGTAAVHARFLETLARRLVGRPEVFRVLLGPAFPGHRSHFHFDMAPYRLVAIWDDPTAAAAR